MLYGKIYYKNSDTEVVKPIDADHISFEAIAGDYHVRPTLIYANDEVLCSDANGGILFDTARNTYINSLPSIKIWNGGMCYYYTYITHLNGKPAVIRNHWYTVTVNSVTGLGTPVYDETDTYDPTRPVDDEWVVGATIKIEAWRIQSQNLNMTSTKDINDSHEEDLDSNWKPSGTNPNSTDGNTSDANGFEVGKG
jgi:hypothetical protein